MDDLLKNQKVKIFFEVDNERKEVECSVKEVFKDRMVLTTPKEVMQHVKYLGEGAEVFIKIFTLVGVQMMDSVVLNSPLEYEFIVEYDEDAVLIQRREYQRFVIETPLTVEYNGEEVVAETKSINISGGGVKFYCEKKLEGNYPTSGTLHFSGHENISFEGDILEKEDSEEDVYVIMFTSITEADRDKLIKVCSKIQFENNKLKQS